MKLDVEYDKNKEMEGIQKKIGSCIVTADKIITLMEEYKGKMDWEEERTVKAQVEHRTKYNYGQQ